jgi:hypothetical protein
MEKKLKFFYFYKGESEFDRPKDACRLYGQLELTKVSGNFHIIAGK